MRTFFKALRVRGVRRTLKFTRAYLHDLVFDWRHGLDTFTWVPGEALDAVPGDVHTASYQPTPIRPLQRLFRQLHLQPDTVLVDFGCGKGRVLLIGAGFGLRQVRGVEYSPALCELARDNCHRYLSRKAPQTRCEIIQADAREYAWRDDEGLVFLFNPFGPEIMQAVVAGLAASLQRQPRQAWVVYCNPQHRDIIDAQLPPSDSWDFESDGLRFAVYQYAARAGGA